MTRRRRPRAPRREQRGRLQRTSSIRARAAPPGVVLPGDRRHANAEARGGGLSSRRISRPLPLTLRAALYTIPCSRTARRRCAGTRCAHSPIRAPSSRSPAGDEETGEIAARVERAVKRLRTLLDRARQARTTKAARKYNEGPREGRRQDLQGDARARSSRWPRAGGATRERCCSTCCGDQEDAQAHGSARGARGRGPGVPKARMARPSPTTSRTRTSR